VPQEWHAKCLSYQELITANIPCADDRSRAAHEAQQQPMTKPSNGQGAHGVLSGSHCNMQGSREESPVELLPTPEEQLLGALVQARQVLNLALRVHDDVEAKRMGMEPGVIEHCQKGTRPHRTVSFLSSPHCPTRP
jgi:hypothetical protein